MTEFPRMVYQVKRIDGKLTVVQASLIGRRGSWFSFKNPSGEWKENGLKWSDTMMEAIHRTAAWVCYQLTLDCYKEKHLVLTDTIQELIQVAAECGMFVGEITKPMEMGAKRKAGE